MAADTITISRREYEELIDARDAAIALASLRNGAETLSEAELDDYLAAATPLAFWRRRCGMTQAALAQEVGVSQPYLAQIEAGQRTGDVHLYARLARQLRLSIEDLIADEDPEMLRSV